MKFECHVSELYRAKKEIEDWLSKDKSENLIKSVSLNLPKKLLFLDFYLKEDKACLQIVSEYGQFSTEIAVTHSKNRHFSSILWSKFCELVEDLPLTNIKVEITDYAINVYKLENKE